MRLNSHLLVALCVSNALGLSLPDAALSARNVDVDEVKISARGIPVCDFWSSSHTIQGQGVPRARSVAMHYTFLVDVDRPEDVVRTFGEDKRGATEALKKFEGPYLRYLWNDMWYSDDLNFRGVYLAEKDGQKAKWGLQIESTTGNYHETQLVHLTASMMIYFRDSHRIVEHQVQDALLVEVTQVGEWTGFRERGGLSSIYHADSD